MRDHDTIAAELVKAKQAYHDAVDIEAPRKLRELEGRIVALQAEAVDTLRVGAIPCKGCGNLPHAMMKSPGVFEVGCLACKPTKAPSRDNPRMAVVTEPRARGATAAEAVKAWNSGNHTRKNEPAQA